MARRASVWRHADFEGSERRHCRMHRARTGSHQLDRQQLAMILGALWITDIASLCASPSLDCDRIRPPP